MLQFGLVLVFASSVLAAPSIDQAQLTLYTDNELGPIRNNGRPSYLTQLVWNLLDDSNLSVNVLTLEKILNDLADVDEAAALGEILAVLGDLVPGVPGDACGAASLIYAYKTRGNVRAALAQWVRQLTVAIDQISNLAADSRSVKYVSGPRGNCPRDGRSYDFESAWDSILASTSPYNAGLVREAYCTAKRLYYATNIRSNIVGAQITAASLPPSQRVFDQVRGYLAYFFKQASTGGNTRLAALNLKNALAQAVARVQL